MGLTSEDVLGWTRVGVLLLAMGWAAWMDHKDRRVPNGHWMVWVKPALFIWALDLMAQNADWTIYLTASAVVAYASTAIIGRPTLSDVLARSKIDIKKSFRRDLMVLLTDTTHIGVINVVKIINKIEIPSTPTL